MTTYSTSIQHDSSSFRPITHEFSTFVQQSSLLDVLPIILGYFGSKAHREISETLNGLTTRRIKLVAKPSPIRSPDLAEFLIDREVLKVICAQISLPPRLLSYIFSYFSLEEMRLVCHPSLRILNQKYTGVGNAFSLIKEEIESDASANKVVCDVMQIENCHFNHTFFYHGMALSHFLSTFFTDALFTNIIHEKRNFIPLMPLPNATDPQTIQEFLKLYPPDEDPIYDTSSKEVRRSLLSVNLSLFSNADQEMESTWGFYRKNYNMKPRKIRENLEDIFNTYMLVSDPTRKNDYLIQLEKQYEKLKKSAIEYQAILVSGLYDNNPPFKVAPSGVLIQLAVPNELVDKVAYPCEDFGLPCDISESGGFSNLVQELSHHERLNQLSRKAGDSYSKRCDNLAYRLKTQARLLVPAVQVPDHNIQVFVHGYGRFFDDRLKELSPVLRNGEVLPWDFSNNLRRAQEVSALENSQACLTLVKQKEEIILNIRAIFAEILLENAFLAE